MDDLEDHVWLYRGVPAGSDEVRDVQAIGEVRPPYPSRIGEEFRRPHMMLNATQTGYTSWTTDRSIAEAAAEEASAGLSGGIVIFHVRVADVSERRIFPGREDEDEWLIEGTVEEVSITEGDEEDFDDEDEHD